MVSEERTFLNVEEKDGRLRVVFDILLFAKALFLSSLYVAAIILVVMAVQVVNCKLVENGYIAPSFVDISFHEKDAK